MARLIRRRQDCHHNTKKMKKHVSLTRQNSYRYKFWNNCLTNLLEFSLMQRIQESDKSLKYEVGSI